MRLTVNRNLVLTLKPVFKLTIQIKYKKLLDETFTTSYLHIQRDFKYITLDSGSHCHNSYSGNPLLIQYSRESTYPNLDNIFPNSLDPSKKTGNVKKVVHFYVANRWDFLYRWSVVDFWSLLGSGLKFVENLKGRRSSHYLFKDNKYLKGQTP